MMLKDFNMVNNCGIECRTVMRYNNIYHIGCFTGTYEEAVLAIQDKYTDSECVEYIAKLDSIKDTSIVDNTDIDITADNNHALHIASAYGYLEVIKYLVEHGSDVTADDNYAIKWSSRNRHLDVTKCLVEHGADVTAYDNYAVRWSSHNGHLDTVKYLVKHGASI